MTYTADELPAATVQLETLVDKFGVADVLGMLTEICQCKAEHLRTNWNDTNAAAAWERCANMLDRATSKALNLVGYAAPQSQRRR